MDFEVRRSRIVESIPSSYNDVVHATIPSLVGIVIILYCLVHIEYQLWMLPLVMLVLFGSFGFEWFVHKNVLHHKFPGLGVIFKKHIEHHSIFTDQDMAMRSRKELHLILMPAYAIFAVLLFISPIIFLISLISLQVAMVIFATMMCFFISYEWLHYCYHHPPGTFISSIRMIRYLKEHHRVHHNLKNMQQYNFNVTIPLFDKIMRTSKK